MRTKNNLPHRIEQAKRAIDNTLLRAQVDALAQAGLLCEELVDPRSGKIRQEFRLGSYTLYAFVRESFEDALAYAEIYQMQPEQRARLKDEHGQLLADAGQLRAALERFVGRWGGPIAIPRPFLLLDAVIEADQLSDRLRRLIEVQEPYILRKPKGGHPSNRWLLGFIARMAWCWRLLTLKRISSAPGGRFFKFVNDALDVVKINPRPILTKTVIDTAIKRFNLK